MASINSKDSGKAVLDLQQRLVVCGYLEPAEVTGRFDVITKNALSQFAKKVQIEFKENVERELWAALVDASFEFGDRSLYLKLPYFHGNDVIRLQSILNTLGFTCGDEDGLFGPETEYSLRRFQDNMGLDCDGIAGSNTYMSVHNLHHSWADKSPAKATSSNASSFARASEVLEKYAVCFFGTSNFMRDIAARISNLAVATNPASKILSAQDLHVIPTKDMLIIELSQEGAGSTSRDVPRVDIGDESALALKMDCAIKSANKNDLRIKIVFSRESKCASAPNRSAQHYSVVILDALCQALS